LNQIKFGVATRNATGNIKFYLFLPMDNSKVRVLVMNVEGVRHHTHPKKLVSTNSSFQKLISLIIKVTNKINNHNNKEKKHSQQ
jgi:hypothetical protein